MRRRRGILWALLAAAVTLVCAQPASTAASYKYLLPGISESPGKTLPRIVALTFDDGPDDVTVAIAQYLAREGVPATFFLVGSRIAKRPDVVRELAGLGFELGNHSVTHPDLRKMRADKMSGEISECSRLIGDITGKRPRFFRPPFGSFNTLVVNEAWRQGMTTVLWTVDALDWTEPGADATVQRVVAQARPGSVVLLHSNHMQTAEALPEMVSQLRAKGYRFVGLDEWFSSVLGRQIAPAVPHTETVTEPPAAPGPPLAEPELPAMIAHGEIVNLSGGVGRVAKIAQPEDSLRVYSNVANLGALYSLFRGAVTHAPDIAIVPTPVELAWREELPARIEPLYREDFLLNRREFAENYYPQPAFYLLTSTEELPDMDLGLLGEMAKQGGITEMLLIQPADAPLTEVGDFGVPAKLVELGEFDPTAVFDLARDSARDLLWLYEQKKEAIFVLVTARDFASIGARENLENAAQMLLRFRQLTCDRIYDPGADVARDWLPENCTLARFTGGDRTTFVLTAPESMSVALPRALRKTRIVTLVPGEKAAMTALLSTRISISPDPTYLITD